MWAIYDNSLCQAEHWVVLPIIPVQSTRTELVEKQKQFVSFLTVVTALNPQNEGFPPLWWARAHPTLPVIGWCSKPEKSQPIKATSAGLIIDWWGENYKLSEKSLPSMICWSQLWVWAWVQTQTQTPSSHLCVRSLEVNHNPSEYMQNYTHHSWQLLMYHSVKPEPHQETPVWYKETIFK